MIKKLSSDSGKDEKIVLTKSGQWMYQYFLIDQYDDEEHKQVIDVFNNAFEGSQFSMLRELIKAAGSYHQYPHKLEGDGFMTGALFGLAMGVKVGLHQDDYLTHQIAVAISRATPMLGYNHEDDMLMRSVIDHILAVVEEDGLTSVPSSHKYDA